MKHPVGRTQNGKQVYVDLIYSDAAKHIAAQPHLLRLIAEVLPQTTLTGSSLSIECDMGRTIGYDFVVSTGETDSVFYAQLVHDNIFTRFIKNGEPLATPYLTLVLELDTKKDVYELRNAWIGRLCPPLPGSEQEIAESKAYWARHAFVLSNQPLQLRTVTKTCPYPA
ncbi:MAG TPA: hypothetical protein VKQ34_03920 [Candidatus Saccharimonadales bacterium]|nr:hypothetical protein [Candidatus Saccharimonadales bacterium]